MVYTVQSRRDDLTSANRSRHRKKSKDMLNSSTIPHEFVEGGNVELNYELLVHLNATDKPKAMNNSNTGHGIVSASRTKHGKESKFHPKN